MDSVSRFSRAIGAKARRAVGGPPCFYGTFTGAESTDPDLSKVDVPGAGLDGTTLTHRFVPKLAHVGTITIGARVLCLGNPVCIIGVVVGDITLTS